MAATHYTHVDYHPAIDGQLMAEMLSSSEQAVTAFYTLLGVQRLLLAPPIESARNLVDFVLMGKHSVRRRAHVGGGGQPH